MSAKWSNVFPASVTAYGTVPFYGFQKFRNVRQYSPLKLDPYRHIRVISNLLAEGGCSFASSCELCLVLSKKIIRKVKPAGPIRFTGPTFQYIRYLHSRHPARYLFPLLEGAQVGK